MSQSQDIAAIAERRAAAAGTLARAAGRLARDRLKAVRRDRVRLAAVEAVIGLAGLTGWITLVILSPENVHTLLALGSLCALALCTPLHLCLTRCFGADPEAMTASLAESARVIDAQAERLGEIIRLVAAEASLSPTTRRLISILLDDVERMATEANERERRIRGTGMERTRRHTRIKPRRTRVTVTTPDNRKLLGTVIDVSQSGVAIEGNFPRLAVDADVVIGSRQGRVVRTLPRGLAFEFQHMIPAELLDADIVL